MNFLVLVAGLYYARKQGFQSVMPFTVSLILLLVYSLLSPVFFYMTGRETPLGDDGVFRFVGKSISDYYELGMFLNLIANTHFIYGFVAMRRSVATKGHELRPTSLPSLRLQTIGLYLLFTGIVLADLFISGLNPLDILFGSADEDLFGAESATNSHYFRNCADCLITTIILFAYMQGRRSQLLLLMIPAFVLFALMGFRYRIILTLLGLLIVYGSRSTFVGNIRHWAAIGFGLAYFILFITYNRWNFIAGHLQDLTFNPAEFEYTVFFEQTHGALVDMNLLRYFKENTDAKHDWGLSMFGYILIKALPRAFFPNGEKPYPSPFVRTLDDSLELPNSWTRTGEASLHYGAFYAAFGLAGYVILPLLMGRWIRFVTDRNPVEKPLGFLKQLAFTLALFQFITRGYFPQFVDHFVYLSLPIWLVAGSIGRATQPFYDSSR
ncbi:hypothetical protein [Larkinella soli]|uniref:hypothetical protein n=1 Tax=Larkinella soli TaxID=1770527 RepID=UPI0019CF7D75|nr:hypothetical protein [Larkinella soli]